MKKDTPGKGKKIKVDVKKIKNMLQNKALVASVVLLVLTAAGFITYSVWQNVSTNAAGEDSLGAASRQYVVPVNTELGCILAGRVWDGNGKNNTSEDEGSCKPVCRVNNTEYVKRDNETKRPGYCKGHAHLQNQRFTPEYCIDQLHRVWLRNLGCARQAAQQDKNLAKRYCPNPAFPNYLTENNAIDKCIADNIVRAPGGNQNGTGGTPTPPPATETQVSCELKGRIWDGKQCTNKCVKDGGALLQDSATKTIYCQRAVAGIGEMGQQRCEKLHRIWLGFGCARRVDQRDVDKAPQCVADYPYYNSNFTSPEVKTLTDVCEKDKRTSDRNEQNGILAGTPVQEDPDVDDDPDWNDGNNPSGLRAPLTATFNYQNINTNPTVASTIVRNIKSSLGGRENVVYNFGEINEDYERRILEQEFGNDNWSSFEDREPTAVRFNPNWELASTQRIHLYNNGVVPATPAGNLFVSKIVNTKNKANKLAVINTHWVVNAYSDQGKDTPERKRVWDAAWRKMDSTVTALHNQGFDVVIAADLNRQGRYKGNYPATKAGALRVLATHGPDVILALPAKGRAITDLKTGFIPAPPGGEAFHGGLWAQVRFSSQRNDDGVNNNPGNSRVPATATYSFQNLGRKEPSAAAVFQKIKQSLKERQNVVYNFAEIDEGDSGEHAVLQTVFGGDGWSGFATRVPTLSHLDNSWRVLDSEVVKLHEATGDNTGPERVLTVTRYQHVKNDDTKLAVINTHFVANAYNGGKNPRLREFWDTAMTKLRDRVDRLHDNGFDTVITGDFNYNGKMPSVHASSQQILDSGPDAIIAIPSKGRKVTDKTTGSINTPSGESFHKNIWARLTFANGANGNDGNGNQNNQQNDVKVSDIKIRNLRDAAATTARGENVLKRGVLYRAAELSSVHVNDKDKRQLAAVLGKNATIIDVRTDGQVKRHPDVKVEGVAYKHIPIDGFLDQAPMVNDPVRRAQLRKVLQTVANVDGPVLIHCMAGKDRTGWIVAMIMYVSGANDQEVMKEYMKSIEAWPGGVKPSWLNSGTSLAKKNYGSIHGYLKRGVGLSDNDINKLRQKFKG